ncbi:hypothetical protein FGO68_gene14634 [Halteria grandinella]|uniref:Uncharacterized protein n=1 Tax=Halteria grandinella TaxID=5974 RepID=A0A8J8NHG2_HALGN|nr:hypothetical protein FGO68_gene14634 [Halteria grandinella]
MSCKYLRRGFVSLYRAMLIRRIFPVSQFCDTTIAPARYGRIDFEDSNVTPSRNRDGARSRSSIDQHRNHCGEAGAGVSIFFSTDPYLPSSLRIPGSALADAPGPAASIAFFASSAEGATGRSPPPPHPLKSETTRAMDQRVRFI